LQACQSSGPTVIGAPCKGSKISLKYPHSIAMTRICAPLSAAADSKIGTRYKKPVDDSGDSQSTQAISPISTTAMAPTVSRLDSVYDRNLSSRDISARLSHTGWLYGNYLSHGWQAEAPAPQVGQTLPSVNPRISGLLCH
jgi:hypothetical protein